MIATLLSHPLFPAALLSFFAGIFGYAVAFFWIRPLWRYRNLRRRALIHLKDWDPARSAVDQEDRRRRARESRKLSVALTATHNEQLPPWYRMVLARRREAPVEAARHLLALADTHNPEHAVKRAAKVRTALAGGKTGSK